MKLVVDVDFDMFKGFGINEKEFTKLKIFFNNVDLIVKILENPVFNSIEIFKFKNKKIDDIGSMIKRLCRGKF
jgi:outer membrane protein assembly factor BamA